LISREGQILTPRQAEGIRIRNVGLAASLQDDFCELRGHYQRGFCVLTGLAIVASSNTAIKQVVGNFTCETDLDSVLAGPIAAFRASDYSPSLADLERGAAMDRIIAAQRTVGRGA